MFPFGGLVYWSCSSSVTAALWHELPGEFSEVGRESVRSGTEFGEQQVKLRPPHGGPSVPVAREGNLTEFRTASIAAWSRRSENVKSAQARKVP